MDTLCVIRIQFGLFNYVMHGSYVDMDGSSQGPAFGCDVTERQGA